ncbi:MAG: hypothetical protein VSS75_004355 [Candidatus Parabeggiatoa sp.]|nr:hypothetical protein [Candidatus Parabeggiatoa sp.]
MKHSHFLIILLAFLCWSQSVISTIQEPLEIFSPCSPTLCENLQRDIKSLCRALHHFSVPLIIADPVSTCACPCIQVLKGQKLVLDISPMIHSSRRFIQIYLVNHELYEVLCRYIKIKAFYINGKNESIGYREVSLQNIRIPSNHLELQLDTGKELIEMLEIEYSNPSISKLDPNVDYDCFY